MENELISIRVPLARISHTEAAAAADLLGVRRLVHQRNRRYAELGSVVLFPAGRVQLNFPGSRL